MRENHILQFSIVTNLSSMNITGYIEFAVLIDVKISSHQKIVEKIYCELQEYLLHIPHRYQKEVIFAVFSCPNISAVNLILRRLESYDGVNKVESFITTSLTIYQDWLRSEIDKRKSVKSTYHHEERGNNKRGIMYNIVCLMYFKEISCFVFRGNHKQLIREDSKAFGQKRTIKTILNLTAFYICTVKIRQVLEKVILERYRFSITRLKSIIN